MISNFKHLKKQELLYLFIILVIPSIFIFTTLKIYAINLWYDPSRDLLMAWDNITKPTLIGPQSGVPGIYYGAYWIWLLSFGLLFSKNPIIVTFITATLPYLIIFPFIWFRLSKYLDRTSLILGWLLFILGNGTIYATQLWNPYPAPLLTLAMIVLLVTTDLSKVTRKSKIAMFFVGVLLALVINFHISFGITLIPSIFLFLLIDTILERKFNKALYKLKNRLLLIGFTILGFLTGYLPAIIFELRHNFMQTKALLYTLLKFGNVVALKGLSRTDIFQEYFRTLANVIHISNVIGGIIFIILLIILLYNITQKKIKNYNNIRIGLLAITILIGSAIIYFTAKNPVWEYHFIGVDIAFLLFITYAASNIPIFKKILLAWTIIIVAISFFQLGKNINGQTPYFYQQTFAVKTITRDADGSDYSVYSFSRSIYMFDYAYLFRWLAGKDIPYDPGFIKRGKIVYLIVPSKRDAYITDFIHSKTRGANYYVAKTWHTADITIIKNVKR